MSNKVKEILDKSVNIKPKWLKMSPLKWKHLLRNIIRSKNCLLTGYTGSGKTRASIAAIEALDRDYEYFNMGSTQDPRSSLVGTREAKDGSTYFKASRFAKAIQKEKTVILLDEISRADYEAWNILLSVLDYKLRYLQLDEASEGNDKVNVAKGVSFIATANIGREFTSTRTVDRALLDRFSYIEMDLLNDEQEKELLVEKFPEVDEQHITAMAKIANQTRDDFSEEQGNITTLISTRMSIEAMSLVRDGFSLSEALELEVLPVFSTKGGEDSERNYVKKIVESFAPTEEDMFGSPFGV